MRLTKLLPILVLLCAARAMAQTPEQARPALVVDPPVLLYTTEPVMSLGLKPLVERASGGGRRASGVEIRDSSLPADLQLPRFASRVAADFAPSNLDLGPWTFDAGRSTLRRFDAPTLRRLDAPTLRRSAASTLPRADAAPDTAEAAPNAFGDLELPAAITQAADLSLRVDGRGELGGAWSRYRPCDPALRLDCNPDLFPRLQPDIQFGVQVAGTISERIHVDVDYDQRREFDAANNINVYYRGQPGELVQRVEMGDVSIALPPSRYLTQGIPAGNFGFKAAARMGALDVEAVWAQQKGDVAAREFRLAGAGRAGLVQDQELVLDDAEYVRGQFFFLVDPSRLAGAPHVDVLTVERHDAPVARRPLAEGLVVYRDEGVTVSRLQDQGSTGKFLADAVSEDGALRHSGLFTLLEPGRDYFVHASGLWLGLRSPLRDDEALAVAYVTETGDTVGDPSAETAPPGEKPELRLLRAPVALHQPGQPTWPWELHQVYRLDSSTEVETGSLELVISLGHMAGGATFKEHAGRHIPLLRLFGLDDDAPADRVDVAHLFRPGADLAALDGTALRGTFVVFPTLEPFGRPPPVPSEGLSATESGEVLGADANPVIYDQVDPVIRQGGSRFRLNFRYRVRLEGLPSSFNLGAFGIREGSERITVDDRLLRRNVDYVIEYDLGLVTLLDPQAVLGGNPDAEIRVTWEQKAIFEVAPTTVFGLNARTDIGPYGELNLVGLYQAEQSIVRRPQLGMAPGAVVLGGASGRLAFQTDWVVCALDAIPLLAVDSGARLDVAGELALSAPDPNRQGDTYLDDFEATDELPLSLDAFEWKLGSAPQDATGVPELPWPPTVENAVAITWQDRYLDAEDREIGFLTAEQIDQQIALAGARIAERVLHLSLGRQGTPAAATSWRSITTVLSTTGRDLSRSEFLEFYAAPLTTSVNDAILVIDIGVVGEDAFHVDAAGNLEGVDSEGRPWGRGVLDEEAELARREVWGPGDDRVGLWAQDCEADRLNPVPLGDARANCTVLNGRPDSEDLNANGVLDEADGPLFRYVVPLGANSPFLVRDQSATGTPFRLFRIPLRSAQGIALNGATEASWRFARHIRVTVVKQSSVRGTIGLARLRIAGSRWTKRATHGILGGLTGDGTGIGAGTASLRVGPVSQLTDGATYTPPPGVEQELQDPKSAIGTSGVEFNEKSLRLSWEDLPADERAEVYFRYPQGPRSFLEYRQLRLWAVPIQGKWGETGDHRLLIKLGTDARNYYLFQTRLHAAAGNTPVSAEDWLPEHLIEFDRWFALKTEAERMLIARGGVGPLEVWSSDSAYAIVLEDRARAPNLAAVRELGFAVYNAGGADTEGELWLDELRLGAGARDPGIAGRVDVALEAGGFLNAALTFGGRGGRFRQLDDFATYQASDELNLTTTAELGRFVPAAWGVAMPMTVSYFRTSLDPVFLAGTDVAAERLPGLRETGASRRRVSLSLRKTTPTDNPLVAALVDGTSLRLGYVSAADETVTSASRLSGIDGSIDYDRVIANVDVDVVPDFLEDALRWLAPRRVEDSEFFGRLSGARLRLTPARVAISTSYVSQVARASRFQGILVTGRDEGIAPIVSPRRGLETIGRLTIRPFESLTGQVALRSGRDLLEPERATPLALERQALGDARAELAGVDIGWERDRTLVSDLAFRPAVAAWLRPSATWSTQFTQRRDPAYLEVVAAPDGTRGALQRTFHADRRLSRELIFDAAAALRAAGWRLGLLQPLKPFELVWTDELGSRFDRELARPDWRYQLGVAGFDAFRFVDGDTAHTMLRRDAFRARSGLRLGSSAFVDLSYGESGTGMLDLRAGRRDRLERFWPDLQVSWPEVPVPGWISDVIARWSFATGYVHTERVTALKGDIDRLRSEDEGTVPVEVRLGFVGGLALSYIASFADGDGRDPTGSTEQQGFTHGIDLSGRFLAPAPLRSRIPQPIRLSLAYDYQSESHCRQAGNLGAASPCTPFIDYLNRRLNLTASTLMSQLDVGLQVSYIDRRSFIGTHAGSSQFQLGLFGQFALSAGTFEGR